MLGSREDDPGGGHSRHPVTVLHCQQQPAAPAPDGAVVPLHIHLLHAAPPSQGQIFIPHHCFWSSVLVFLEIFYWGFAVLLLHEFFFIIWVFRIFPTLPTFRLTDLLFFRMVCCCPWSHFLCSFWSPWTTWTIWLQRRQSNRNVLYIVLHKDVIPLFSCFLQLFLLSSRLWNLSNMSSLSCQCTLAQISHVSLHHFRWSQRHFRCGCCSCYTRSRYWAVLFWLDSSSSTRLLTGASIMTIAAFFGNFVTL